MCKEVPATVYTLADFRMQKVAEILRSTFGVSLPTSSTHSSSHIVRGARLIILVFTSAQFMHTPSWHHQQ